MKYMIGKISNDCESFGFLSPSDPNVQFDKNVYLNIESAKQAIHSRKFELDKRANDDFDKKTETQKKDILKKLKDPNAVYSLEKWVIIPVEDYVEVTSNIDIQTKD